MSTRMHVRRGLGLPALGLPALGLPTMVLLAGLAAPAQADWQTCVADLRQRALDSGVPDNTVASVMDTVVELPRVISADRSQPEFTQTFTQYYNARVTPERVEKGREMLTRHASFLALVQRETGIPPQYLVALWGLETNYGSYFGTLSIPSALTTLACDSRRADFFANELLAVLKIIAAGDIDADALIGSWAGAIGHMQFMPTTYLAHAVDGDGDGRRDLLGSLTDALTSGAAYLESLGWQAGYRWGREVVLPENFDHAQAGRSNWQSLAYWSETGIKDTFDRPLAPIDLEAALLLPSGHTGPAFLVYPNFKTLMKWNRSESYALSVGRLADRIAGAGRLRATLPSERFATADITRLQSNLNTLGYDAGKPDGVLGPGTRGAIRRFQQQFGLIADGYPSTALFTAVAEQINRGP